MREGDCLDEKLRKELLREELKEKNHGRKTVTAKYRPKYPDSAEREYLRMVNAYMAIEKEVIMRYLPEIKQILNDVTQLRADSKKDNEQKRRTARFSVIDNTIVRLTILFKTIRRELDLAFGLYDLKHQITQIANLDHKLTIREWKKAVGKTLGINILDDYYSGEFYRKMLEEWVSENVDLIKTVPNQSLDKMKELVYQSYMRGATTTDIVKEIQRQYGMDKRHAKLIARDQTAKLNANITEHQQRDAGVSRYKWSGVLDRRERRSHRELEGHIFSWDDPPETDRGRRCHPGQDYQCRCCALPVFDIDSFDPPV